MNRIIAQIGISAVMLLFVACDWDIMDLFKSNNKRFTDCHYMINPRGKRIVHELTFGIPREHRDSTLLYFTDGSNAQEELEWTVSYVVGLMSEQTQAVIGYKAPCYLYNISDTTSLRWDKYWNRYDDSLKFCPFYWKDGSEGFACDNKECNRIANYYVMVSDSLLSLMQKDYDMLDKFKEYYAHE
jgi:hypothetical protein